MKKKDGIHYQIALSQFDLLIKLCVGNNENAIQILTMTTDNVIAIQLTFNFIIKAINGSSGLLRARLVELLKGTHIQMTYPPSHHPPIPIIIEYNVYIIMWQSSVENEH